MIELLDLSRSYTSGDFLGELIDMFYGELSSRLASIREASSHRRFTELDERAHELKGSCLSLGLARMAALCSQIEALARAGTAEGAQALLDQIETEAGVVRPLLETERLRAARKTQTLQESAMSSGSPNPNVRRSIPSQTAGTRSDQALARTGTTEVAQALLEQIEREVLRCPDCRSNAERLHAMRKARTLRESAVASGAQIPT